MAFMQRFSGLAFLWHFGCGIGIHCMWVVGIHWVHGVLAFALWPCIHCSACSCYSGRSYVVTVVSVAVVATVALIAGGAVVAVVAVVATVPCIAVVPVIGPDTVLMWWLLLFVSSSAVVGALGIGQSSGPWLFPSMSLLLQSDLAVSSEVPSGPYGWVVGICKQWSSPSGSWLTTEEVQLCHIFGHSNVHRGFCRALCFYAHYFWFIFNMPTNPIVLAP